MAPTACSVVLLLVLAYHVQGAGLEYRVELQSGEQEGRRQLLIRPVCSRYPLILTEDQTCSQYPRGAVGVRPLVHLSPCSQAVAPGVADSTVTLVTAAVEESSLTWTGNQSVVAVQWQVELPDPFNHTKCFKTTVKESVLGQPIAETRLTFHVESTDDPFAANLTCALGAGSECTVIGSTSAAGAAPIALLRHDNQSYSIYYSDSGSTASLPACIGSQGFASDATPQWRLVQNLSLSCEENGTDFIPSELHALMKNEIFISGNGLLYSPNRNGVFYELQLPSSVHVSSFTLSGNRLFAVITTSNISSPALWVGVAGQAEMLQTMPTDLPLAGLCSSDGCSHHWSNSSLLNATLHFDGLHDLHVASLLSYGTVVLALFPVSRKQIGNLVDGTADYKMPLPLMLLHARYRVYSGIAVNASMELSLTEMYNRMYLLGYSALQHVLLQSTFALECPYTSVLVEAPLCGKITRSRLEVGQEAELRRTTPDSFPEGNCSLAAPSLPAELFLEQAQSYSFTVHFVIDPTVQLPEDLQLAVQVSDPEILVLRVTKLFHSSNSTLSFQVTLQENMSLTEQFEPGYTAASVDLSVMMQKTTLACLDVYSPHPVIPGWLRTRVHVGCPPGLAIVFDAASTAASHQQHCQPTDNISCYYFNNEFHPVLLIADLVTGETLPYSQSYTLRAVAGGTGVANLREFDSSANVELGLWTAISGRTDNLYSLNESGIRWVCRSSSPCGEIIPASGLTPQYYLVLEASNGIVGDETYCNFTVQFTIRIHGMGMGSITVVITQLVVLTLLVATTLALFLVWHFRLRLYYVRDRVIEAVVRRWATTKKSTLQDSQEHENRSLGSSAPDSLAPNSSAPGSVVPDSLALDSSAPGSSVPLSELSKPAVFHEGSFDTEL